MQPGFLLSEGLADVGEIGEIAFRPVKGDDRLVARVNFRAHRLAPIMEHARRRLGDRSCGICGIESVEAALRPLPAVSARSSVRPDAIRAALSAIRNGQTLGVFTAATHAAAFAHGDGSIARLRENVGRHNALDKLMGARARSGIEPASGFMLVTSRCSCGLVEKAARPGCPLFVAISAPTDLAVHRATAAVVMTHQHITDFWEPRMMTAIIACPPDMLSPIAAAAVALLRSRLDPLD